MVFAAARGLGSALETLDQSGGARREPIEAAIWAACVLQFVTLIYKPMDQIPTKKDREAGQKFVKLLADTPGDVSVPYHGYYATLAGKRPSAQTMNVFDVLRADNNDIKKNSS